MILTLKTHPSSPPPKASWTVATQITVAEDYLRLTYCIHVDDLEIEVPPPKANPTRLDDLWKATCCEVFLRLQNNPQRYLEFNFSPSGDWAFYRFKAYREAPERPKVLFSPSISTEIQLHALSLEARIPQSMIKDHLSGDGRLEGGVSVILKHRLGTLSYWASKHPAEKPDFHHPDSFIAL